MRRPVLRILLNAATVLSLLLCVATMAAWVRSYQARDTLSWSRANPRMHVKIATVRGGLFATVTTPNGLWDDLPPPGVRWQYDAPTSDGDPRDSPTLLRQLGFYFDYDSIVGVEVRELICPYWFITLLTAILPSARLAGWRRRVRRLRMRPGLCRHCGYDCRATPQGGRCPECGTPSSAG